MFILRFKSGVLAAGLLLAAAGAQAQSGPKPSKGGSTDVTVRVVLPASLAAIKDYAGILISKDQDKLKTIVARHRKPPPTPEFTFSVPLPKSVAKKLTGN